MEKLDKIDAKIDKMDERLDSMTATLIRNTESLEHHIARTDALEEYVKAELTPVKRHVDAVKYGIKGIFWAASVLGSLATFLFTLYKLGILKF